MSTVAALVAVGGFAVAFLIRFLFALEADVRRPASPRRQPERVLGQHVEVSASAGKAALALYLAHRNPNPAAPKGRGTEPTLVAMDRLPIDRDQRNARRSDRARLGA